jgi:hypothetical protein
MQFLFITINLWIQFSLTYWKRKMWPKFSRDNLFTVGVTSYRFSQQCKHCVTIQCNVGLQCNATASSTLGSIWQCYRQWWASLLRILVVPLCLKVSLK